ncbi:MAG: response regulator transcription factor [Burkholderiales bacterium]
MNSTAPIRLLLVDDHVIVRLGLHAVFEESTDIEVVGEAASVLEAVESAARLSPDVV